MPGRFSHNKGQYSIIQMEAGHLRENPQIPQQEEAPQAITNAAKGLMGLILADAEREKNSINTSAHTSVGNLLAKPLWAAAKFSDA